MSKRFIPSSDTTTFCIPRALSLLRSNENENRQRLGPSRLMHFDNAATQCLVRLRIYKIVLKGTLGTPDASTCFFFSPQHIYSSFQNLEIIHISGYFNGPGAILFITFAQGHLKSCTFSAVPLPRTHCRKETEPCRYLSVIRSSRRID